MIRTTFPPVLTDGTTALPLTMAHGVYSRDGESGLIVYEWHARWALPVNPLGSTNLRLALPLPSANPGLGEGGWARSGLRGIPPMQGYEVSGAIDGDKFRFYWTGAMQAASIPIPGSALFAVGGAGGVITYHGPAG